MSGDAEHEPAMPRRPAAGTEIEDQVGGFGIGMCRVPRETCFPTPQHTSVSAQQLRISILKPAPNH